MRRIVVQFNRLTSRYFLLLVVLAITTGMLLPEFVADFAVVLPYVLALIVFTMGTSCTVESFRAIVLSPKSFLTAVFVIFAFMPLIGFGVGSIFYPDDPQLLIGHFLVAVTPVAVTSVVWTGIAGGNIALSIALVTVVTLFSGLTIPGMMKLYLGTVVDFDALALVASLSRTIVVPALVGLVVRNRLPRLIKTGRPYLDLAAKLGMTTVLVINGSVLKPIVAQLGWEMTSVLLVAGVHVFANFGVAFGTSFLVLGRRHPSVSAVMYSSSMRNNAAGLVIAANYFGPTVTLPIIGCMILQHFSAGVFYRVLAKIGAKPVPEVKPA